MKLNSKINQLLPYLILIVFGCFLLLRLLIIGSHHTDLAGIEQNVVYSIQMLMENGHLYTSPAKAPFSITQYTPFYYYLCSYTAKIIGCSPGDIQNIYIIGRLWDLLFNILSALVVYKIARSIFSLSKNKSYFLFLLSFTLTFSHNFAVRPDSLCDLFGLLSFFYFLKYQLARPSKDNNTILFLTVLCTAIAFFSKQSGIQLILIYGAFALFNTQWKTLLKLVIFSVFTYGIFLFVFKYQYPSFLENVVGGVVNGINIQNFIKYIIAKTIFVIAVWPLIIIALILMIKYNLLYRGSATERLLSIAVVGTLCFATLTALKMGSTVQYYILFINLSLLLILKVIQDHAEIANSPAEKYLDYREIAFNSYLSLVIFVFGAYNVKLIISSDHNPELAKQRNSAIVAAQFIEHDQVKNSGKYIFAYLTTDTSIPSRQRINNIFFKNCIVPQMDILEYSTGKSKVIGYQNIQKMLNDGEIEYIIGSKPKPSFTIVSNLDQIISTKYKLIKTIDGYLIYKFLSN